jgi:hypothetical protein
MNQNSVVALSDVARPDHCLADAAISVGGTSSAVQWLLNQYIHAYKPVYLCVRSVRMSAREQAATLA